MYADRMHAGEVNTDRALVRRLLVAQFPHWAELPITSVVSAGTDNAIFRLGDDLAVRLPRIDWAVSQVEKEHYWLPRIAPYLPLAISAPLAKGEPGEGYPWHWSVYRWLEGESATLERLSDPIRASVEMARFITALQSIDPTGGPPAVEHGLRGLPLKLRDDNTRAAIAALAGMFDAQKLTRVWEVALQAQDWERTPAWFHGDLLPGNLLIEGGHLKAVIDFGGLGVGDPACDLMVAWGLFSGKSRDTFRVALGVDEATWRRGRGHALSQAVIFIPYYLETNPVGVENARRMVEAVLADMNL